jgi:hypothetical protein
LTLVFSEVTLSSDTVSNPSSSFSSYSSGALLLDLIVACDIVSYESSSLD